MLRLSRGHAVSRHKDHLVCVRELHRNIIRRDFAHNPFDSAGSGNLRAESSKEDVGDRPVHGTAHEDGEDETGESVERASDDQNVVTKYESSRRRGQTGV